MVKGKLKVKVSAKKGAIKPKMGRGTGGILTTKIIASVNREESK